jgi:NADPH:quinone reductase-like Zn-dependent oxidoreductase
MYEHELPTVRRIFDDLATLYRQKAIAPVVSKTLPLERVAEALAAIGSRGTVGKIVLIP